MGTLRFDDAPDVDLFAYTFSFGNGFSATLSIEDGLERRSTASSTAGFERSCAYAGQRAPDVVGNLKYAGTWGTAQLSGAVHQIRATTSFAIVAASPTSRTPSTASPLRPAAGVNLPSLAPGDALWITATYADGALGYLDGGNAGTIISPSALSDRRDLLLSTPTSTRLRRHQERPRLVHRRWPAPLLDPASPFEPLRFVRARRLLGWLAARRRHCWPPTSTSTASAPTCSGTPVCRPRSRRRSHLRQRRSARPRPGPTVGPRQLVDAWEGRLRVQRDF